MYHVIEAVAPLLHGGDVGLLEVAVLAVQRVQVMVKDQPGKFLVDAAPAIVSLLEDTGDPRRELLLTGGGLDGPVGQMHGNGRYSSRAGGGQQQQAGAREGDRGKGSAQAAFG